ncbi:Ribosome-releasing factor 2, mitochondrial, partial [Friedmanniomyces endolithicus]
PLLDAVVDLLPSPDELADPEVSIAPGIKGGLSQFLSGRLTAPTTPDRSNPSSKSKPSPTLALQDLSASCCALAFKVVADPKRGVLVYLRVYSGTLTRNSTLWNTNLQVSERAQRLLKMYANDAVEVESIAAGQIGVIPGLKFARTGTHSPIDVPPPVFFVSVEPNSLAEAKHIGESLDLLLREDPSLHVSVDEESGQTLLSGMGELHLEIARDRLVGDLRAKARLGGIEIGYREAVTGNSGADGDVEGMYEREVAGRWAKGGVGVVIEPLSEGGEVGSQEHEQVFELADKNYLVVATPTLQADGSAVSEETIGLPEPLLPMSALMLAFRNGVSAACARGPSHGYPMHSTLVRLTFDPARHVFPNTTLAALASAARLGVLEALKVSAKGSETALMEPVMLVTISVDEGNLGAVVQDISSARGGSIVSLDSEETASSSQSGGVASVDVSRIYAPPDPFAGGGDGLADLGTGGLAGGMKQIVARVPLKEMVGYLKHLRSLTGGRGTFTMIVDRFERMGGQRMKAVLSGMR